MFSCVMTALRFVILLTAFVIIGYLYNLNRKPLQEQFENIDSETALYYDTIRTLVQTYLLRRPEQYELERYKKLMSHSRDVDPVITAIKKSDEYVNIVKSTPKTSSSDNASLPPVLNSPNDPDNQRVDSVVDSMPLQERTNLYKSIISVYDMELERMPSMRELNYYSYRMISDPKFDTSRLRTVLQSSTEYGILQKNQKNTVNAELEGKMTDAQITLEVRRLYTTVFEEDILPSEEVEKFLKYKYRSYELNEQRFVEFLLLLKALENNNIDITKMVDGTINISGSASTNNPGILDMLIQVNSSGADQNVSTRGETSVSLSTNSTTSSSNKNAGTTGNVYNNSQIYNIINPSKEAMDSILDGVEDATRQQQVTSSSYGRGAPTSYKDPLYESLQKEQNNAETCTWDKNQTEDTLQREHRERNKLAEVQKDRNVDNLRASCKRNSYFLNADENMVLFPEFKWEVPQKRTPLCTGSCSSVEPITIHQSIAHSPLTGTPLEEAENTKVGSMLPRFVYKEIS